MYSVYFADISTDSPLHNPVHAPFIVPPNILATAQMSEIHGKPVTAPCATSTVPRRGDMSPEKAANALTSMTNYWINVKRVSYWTGSGSNI